MQFLFDQAKGGDETKSDGDTTTRTGTPGRLSSRPKSRLDAIKQAQAAAAESGEQADSSIQAVRLYRAFQRFLAGVQGIGEVRLQVRDFGLRIALTGFDVVELLRETLLDEEGNVVPLPGSKTQSAAGEDSQSGIDSSFFSGAEGDSGAASFAEPHYASDGDGDGVVIVKRPGED